MLMGESDGNVENLTGDRNCSPGQKNGNVDTWKKESENPTITQKNSSSFFVMTYVPSLVF